MQMGLKKRRRIQLICFAFIFLSASVALLGFGFREGIQYYRTPSEILTAPPPPDRVLRIGGFVSEGSIKRLADGRVRFVLKDEKASVEIVYQGGVLPDLFEEKQGAIALGHYRGNMFEAVQILAKHDENYRPKFLPEYPQYDE